MRPEDFIQTAEKLLIEPSGESDRRSAISRSYYGAFHASRQCLPAQFAPTRAQINSGWSHLAVIDALIRWRASRASGCSTAAEASRGLLTLKHARRRADYDIETSVRQADVNTCLSLSRKVVELVRHARKRFDESDARPAQKPGFIDQPA